MAIFHCTVKAHSRIHDSNNHAVRSAAYRAGTILTDIESGNIYNYSRKSEVTFSEILTPDNAPQFVFDRQQLWNAVEKSEKRVDSRLFREIEVALPIELTREQWKKIIRKFIKKYCTSKGMVADYSIHESDGNPHCHIMLTTRLLNENGFGNKNRELDKRDLVEVVRKGWEESVNAELKAAGLDIRIDRRSYEEQGIDKIPTVHEGRVSINKCNSGNIEHRRAKNRNIRALNEATDELKKLESEIEQIDSEILAATELTQPPVQPAINNLPAPADLMFRARQSLFPERSPQPILKPVYDPTHALPNGCMDVRLPNGKIIYPRDTDALEQAIQAWNLPAIDAKAIRKKFWSACSPEYYNDWLNRLIKSKGGVNHLDKFSKDVLTKLKLAGMSPQELFRCTQDEYFSAEPPLCTIPIRGQPVGITSPEHMISLVKNEPPEEQTRIATLFYSSIKLTEYTKIFVDRLKALDLNLSSADPIQLFRNWKEGITPTTYGKKIQSSISPAFVGNQNNTKTMPEGFVALFTGAAKISHYPEIYGTARMKGLQKGELEQILNEWWLQISPDDYYQEARKFANSRNLGMRFDSTPREEILDGLTEKDLPDVWVEKLLGYGSYGKSDIGKGFTPDHSPRYSNHQPFKPSTLSPPTKPGGSGWDIK